MSHEQPQGLQNTMTIHVAWGDCDAAGIVFYPNYFRWFDACTHGLLESVDLGHRSLGARFGVIGTPLVDSGASFMSPATYGDSLTVVSRVVEVGRSRFVVEHRVSIAQRLVCVGKEVRVWAAQDESGALKAVAFPDEVSALLKKNS